MSPELSRAARALLGWDQSDLAAQACVPVTTIRNFERGAGVPAQSDLEVIRRALEEGGVTFADDPLSPGVRLRVMDVCASTRPDGAWGVVVRWAVGTPSDWMPADTAEQFAAELDRQGDADLAAKLRSAAAQARRNRGR